MGSTTLKLFWLHFGARKAKLSIVVIAFRAKLIWSNEFDSYKYRVYSVVN